MSDKLLCGFGQRDMTPPMGHPVSGYFEPRYASGVIDPLYTRAILFDNGEKKSLIIALDVCWINAKNCADVRDRIAKELNMDADAILINGSHTHTGPDTDPVCEYQQYLKDQLVGAALDAAANMAPARMFYGETEAEGISFIRRFLLNDGTVKTNPAKQVPMIERPLGTPDETLRLLKIVREGADDLYMFNFNTHVDTVGGDEICSDWPGFACTILEAAIPGSKAMFVLGPQGDVNHTNFLCKEPHYGCDKYDRVRTEKAAHARFMARVIAGKVLTICDKAAEVSGSDISFGSQKVDLMVNRPEVTEEQLKEAKALLDAYDAWYANPGDAPRPYTIKSVLGARRIFNLQSAPDFESYHVYGMKIGDFVIATLPGEPFTGLGRQIFAGAGYEKMMVFCNTNGYCGYIPTKDCFDDGGYESNSNRYKSDSPDRLVNGALAVVKEL